MYKCFCLLSVQKIHDDYAYHECGHNANVAWDFAYFLFDLHKMTAFGRANIKTSPLVVWVCWCASGVDQPTSSTGVEWDESKIRTHNMYHKTHTSFSHFEARRAKNYHARFSARRSENEKYFVSVTQPHAHIHQFAAISTNTQFVCVFG